MDEITIMLILVGLNLAVTLWLWKGMATIFMHSKCTHNTLHEYLDHKDQTDSMFDHVMQHMFEQYQQENSTSVQDWDAGEAPASEE